MLDSGLFALLMEVRTHLLCGTYTDEESVLIEQRIRAVFKDDSPASGPCGKEDESVHTQELIRCWFVGYWILHLKELEKQEHLLEQCDPKMRNKTN